MHYEFVEGWARLPAGWRLGDVGGVAVGPRDEVYVFHRGEHPLLVFARDGELIDAWGKGVFTKPHGLAFERDGCLYCTDDGDHTVRKFDTKGRLLQQVGVPHQPSEFLSNRPFNRCTHTALGSNGDLYVTDGYRNACVHCFSPAGELRFTWGASGCAPGEFQVPHNIVCDDEGTLHVADRENHRIQRFDGEGRYLGQWNNLCRPMALALHRVASDERAMMFVGEAGPSFNARLTGLGPRVSVLDPEGATVLRIGDRGFVHAADGFMAPHGVAVDSHGDLYVGEVAHVAWSIVFPGEPVPEGLRTLRKLRRVVAEGRT